MATPVTDHSHSIITVDEAGRTTTNNLQPFDGLEEVTKDKPANFFSACCSKITSLFGSKEKSSPLVNKSSP